MNNSNLKCQFSKLSFREASLLFFLLRYNKSKEKINGLKLTKKRKKYQLFSLFKLFNYYLTILSVLNKDD